MTTSDIVLYSICGFFVLISIWASINFRHRWGRKK
jgi:hypothetical protein